MNTVMLSGRLTKPVEVRTVKVGDKDRKVASGTLAVNNRFSGKAEFYHLDAWDANAETLVNLKTNYFALEGSLKTSSEKGDSIVVRRIDYTNGGNQYGMAQGFILGNLTKDAKYVPGKEANGKKTADGLFFTIAVNVSKDTAYFVDVQVFGPMATSLSKVLTKGKQVLVRGELNAYVSEYEGNKRNRVRINSSELYVLSKKKEDGTDEDAPTAAADETADTADVDISDDDLPF